MIYEPEAIPLRTYLRQCQRDQELAATELRRLREWRAKLRAQAKRVDLPDGPMWLVPQWVMEDDV